MPKLHLALPARQIRHAPRLFARKIIVLANSLLRLPSCFAKAGHVSFSPVALFYLIPGLLELMRARAVGVRHLRISKGEICGRAECREPDQGRNISQPQENSCRNATKGRQHKLSSRTIKRALVLSARRAL